MQVRLRVQVRLPYSNDYINKDTILTVVDKQGKFTVCKYEGMYVFIDSNNLEEIEENPRG
ncbi:MAG: hypothetical protein K6E20_03730 [Acholeplasmatales bacterium]|nr:hypothetical protein [Acholeplasmatales bacterium]